MLQIWHRNIENKILTILEFALQLSFEKEMQRFGDSIKFVKIILQHVTRLFSFSDKLASY